MADPKSPVPHFRIPLNLPHAGTLATRIVYHLTPKVSDPDVLGIAGRLVTLLAPYRQSGENPPPDEARRSAEEAAGLARSLVDSIERLRVGHDRLGQAVRNLFECLELGEEGATISLRAGENPDSVLRAR
jgi:hypothetical protein